MPVSNAYLSESLRFTTGLCNHARKEKSFWISSPFDLSKSLSNEGYTARQLKQNRKGNKGKNALPVCLLAPERDCRHKTTVTNNCEQFFFHLEVTK